MLIVIVLVLAGFMHVAEQPTCRTEASSFVDQRCSVQAQREARRD